MPEEEGKTTSKKVRTLTEMAENRVLDTKSFNDLLKACVPATFGLDGEDILDETYRKAGKLDRSQFSTDFRPHHYGIVDARQVPPHSKIYHCC